MLNESSTNVVIMSSLHLEIPHFKSRTVENIGRTVNDRICSIAMQDKFRVEWTTCMLRGYWNAFLKHIK